MVSAPQSASIRAAVGPALARVKSRTLNLDKGPFLEGISQLLTRQPILSFMITIVEFTSLVEKSTLILYKATSFIMILV